MEPAKDEECSVCVAVNVRPLVGIEQEQGCRSSVFVATKLPQVSIGQHEFMYDHVFGGSAGPRASDNLYPRCVAPLVDSLFNGYNATVFAYGQTGSGKTYTMGSEYKPGGKAQGVIPEVINTIFDRISAMPQSTCTVRVSFVEIHKEEIKDLLLTDTSIHTVVSIRENPGSGVGLYGAVEKEVGSKEEMAAVLEQGTLCRSTGSTGMNSKSSRSHAVFTITLEQRRQMSVSTAIQGDGNDDEDDDEDEAGDGVDAVEDFLCAKMHLVDLAGSERAKRTKAEGARLKEGIHINRGLLALGNVINAIVDNHKHVPYRDSKLTRLLQDSLGGNSRTVMIACVSPADINYEESLNTLRYADRARHIRNKPTINRDPIAAQVAALQQQVSQLRSENTALKKALAAEGKDVITVEQCGADQQWQMLEQMQHDSSALELDNERLKVQMESLREELEEMTTKFINTKAELDVLRIEHPDQGVGGAIPADGDGHSAILRQYIEKIASLEKELHCVKSFQQLTYRVPTLRLGSKVQASGASNTPQAHGGVLLSPHNHLTDQLPTPDGGSPGQSADYGDGGESGHMGTDLQHSPLPDGDEDDLFYAEMAAHAFEQEKMKQDIVALQRVLEQKERKMGELMRNTNQVPALKQHYDRLLHDLESERDLLQKEKKEMLHKLQYLTHASEEERRKLESQYKERIAHYDEKLKEVRRKERDFAVMQKLKHRTDEMCSRLNGDIARIRSQKVALQKNMETSAKQFAQWRVQREKEVLQLRRQNRRNAVQIQHLEAMQAKQNAVLQRKIADANAARKKLKDMQTLGQAAAARERIASSRTTAPVLGPEGAEVHPYEGAPVLRNERQRREWVEEELDSCNQSFEYRRVLEGELAQRAEVYRHLREVMKKLMMIDNLVPSSPLQLAAEGSTAMSQAMLKPTETREKLMEQKAFLEKELLEHNNQIRELQMAWEQAKSADESRGGGAADGKRWAGIRHAAEAIELLKTLFRVASDHKATANDTQLEAIKLQEDMDLMRVKLDAAKKESDAQRRRAAAISATAATAMASPFPSSTPPSKEAANDDDVDELLHQLKVAAGTPGRGGTDAHMVTVEVPAAVVKALEFVSPGEAKEACVQARGEGAHGKDAMEDVTFEGMDVDDNLPTPTMSLSPAPKVEHLSGGWSSQRYSRSPEAVSDSDVASSDDEVDNHDDSEDEDDEDWDPSNPTPAKPGRHQRGLFNLRASSAECESIRQTMRPTASSLAKVRASCSSLSAALSGLAADQERSVLDGINRDREVSGLPPSDKLTVKLLKDYLAGKVVDGKQWKAGSKNKDQLIRDCRAYMGLPHTNTMSISSSMENSNTTKPFCYQSASLSPPARRAKPPSRATSPLGGHEQLFVGSPLDKPLIHSSGQGLAIQKSGHPLRSSSDGHKARHADAKGSADLVDLSTPHGHRAPLQQVAVNRQPALHSGKGSAGAVCSPSPQDVMLIPDTPVSNFSLGERPHGEVLTPLSRLYIQKAQEARERTALLRQSVKKSSVKIPSACNGAGTPGQQKFPGNHSGMMHECGSGDMMDCDSPQVPAGQAVRHRSPRMGSPLFQPSRPANAGGASRAWR